MAVFVFGLFAVALQISGIFSSSVYEYDRFRYGRHPWVMQQLPWLGQHDRQDYRTFRNLQKFYFDRSHLLPGGGMDFDYQLLPQSWANEGISPATNIRSEAPTDNTFPSNSRTVHAKPKSNFLEPEGVLPSKNRKEFPNMRHRLIVKNRNVLNSAVPNEKMKEMGESKNERSLVLSPENNSTADENKQSTENTIDEDLTRSALNMTVAVEKESSENATMEDETSENKTVKDETSENKTVKDQTIENKTVKDETSENKTVKNETIENKTVEDQTIENKTVKDETSENKTVEDQTIENKTVKDETSEITIYDEEITKNITDYVSEDNSTATEGIGSTDSQPTLTHEIPENSTEAMTETAESSDISTLDGTTLPGNNNATDGGSKSSSDSSSPEEKQTTPPIPVTDSPVSQKPSSESTAASSKDVSSTSVSPSSELVTKAVSPVPERVINISSIRTARIVISVVLLVIGIVAVAVLAVYMFRTKRRAVQYDQLTLLP